MPGSPGNPIVRKAIDLLMECPDWPALKILDLVMKEHDDEDPDFESFDPGSPFRPHPLWSDDVFPPSPFAELLRRAFAPKFDPLEAALASDVVLAEADETNNGVLSARAVAAAQRWQAEVIDRFGARYRLWGN